MPRWTHMLSRIIYTVQGGFKKKKKKGSIKEEKNNTLLLMLGADTISCMKSFLDTP